MEASPDSKCTLPDRKSSNDFFSVLQGAINTLNELKTDENTRGYNNTDTQISSLDFTVNGLGKETSLVLPDLNISPRNKKLDNGTNTSTPRTPKRRYSLGLQTTAPRELPSTATNVTIEAETPSTKFWNNPAPPSEYQQQFRSVTLPRIDSASSLSQYPRKNSGSKSVINKPFGRTRRSHSLNPSFDTMSDIREVQSKWLKRNFMLLRPKGHKLRSCWRSMIHKREKDLLK